MGFEPWTSVAHRSICTPAATPALLTLQHSFSLVFNSLRPILVWAGTENALFFVYYVGISMNVFAVGVSHWSYFLASEYGTFLLVIRMNLIIQN